MTESQVPFIPPVEPAGQPAPAPELAFSRRSFLFAAGAALLTTACSSSGENSPEPQPTETQKPAPAMPEVDTSKETDVLRGAWDFMPGTKREGNALRVSHTGLAILKLTDGGRPPANPEYEPNPPVNLFGTHVETKNPGDIGFRARLSEIQGSATLSFLSAPSVRFDERLERQPGVDISVQGNKAAVSIWDGRGPAPTTVQEINLDEASAQADIAVIQTAQGLHITVNGRDTRIPVQLLETQTWFGFDATDGWKLDQLSAYPASGNTLSLIDSSKALEALKPNGNGLQSTAAAHGHGDKLIGTAVDLAELVANPAYAAFVVENFNTIETESLAKFQALQPEEGRFEFAELDALVQFANRHGIRVHGHALAFTEAYPEWLSSKLNDPATTQEDALKLLTTHIETVVGRYDGTKSHGRIDFWDVVNEPFDPDDWGQLNKQSLWYKKLGPSYIAEAFRAARRAHATAKLFMNEWGAEADADRREAVVALAVELKKQGVPIDGVGCQAHFDEDTLNDSDAMGELQGGVLARLFDRLDREGLLVRISEASVAENGDEQTQSSVYELLMSTAMRARNCVGFNFWGATNSSFRYAYFTGNGFNGDPGDDAPTTQDAKGTIHDRPAMDGLRRGAAAR